MMYTETSPSPSHTPSPSSAPRSRTRASLSRGRGRPRKFQTETDLGTPELIMKRALGITSEALDLCMTRHIITPEQHWCGVHFRWLYTLRFGAPNARAVDTRHLGGIDIRPDDPEWRAAREQEYLDAVEKLGKRLTGVLLRLAIYNERPSFLSAAALKRTHPAFAELYAQEQELVCDALDILRKLWCKPRARR